MDQHSSSICWQLIFWFQPYSASTNGNVWKAKRIKSNYLPWFMSVCLSTSILKMQLSMQNGIQSYSETEPYLFSECLWSMVRHQFADGKFHLAFCPCLLLQVAGLIFSNIGNQQRLMQMRNGFNFLVKKIFLDDDPKSEEAF